VTAPIIPATTAFAAFGAVEVPLLQNITALVGTTANCLQSLATWNLETPYTVGLAIPGSPIQFWTARGGTDATDAANGIVQAGDWAETGVVWYKSNP
jgi:hypothetical protein